jgi:hypothetical protein
MSQKDWPRLQTLLERGQRVGPRDEQERKRLETYERVLRTKAGETKDRPGWFGRLRRE